MRKLSYALLCALTLVNNADASTLAEKLKKELIIGSPPITETVKEAVQNTPILMIEGIFNETRRGYFMDNLKSLKADFAHPGPRVVLPPTRSSIQTNAGTLANIVREEFQKQGKPLLIFAHSKGAAEMLLAVLKNPDLVVDGMIERLVLIQGALEGSPIADMVPMGSTAAVGKLWPGLQTLRTDVTKKIFRMALAKADPALNDFLQNKLFYVVTTQSYRETAMVLKPSHIYLTQFFGKNDGLLLESSQRVQGIGKDLGTLEADHVALMTNKTLSNLPATYRMAFTRALLRQLFE